ncbi:MAG TPA: flagellar biosynthetic protein FliR [Polyangiaceae bacterium]|nr:flagellar biosynthetic protein FliR [Polyangiaceae bacterium]
MTGLELLIRNEAALVVLEAIRISGMIIVAPLGFTQAPARVKAALVVLLTLASHGEFGQTPVIEGPLEGLAFSAASEMVLGVAIGLVPRLIVAAVEIAGEQIAPMMGMGVAQIFDPMAHASQNVITSILRNLAMLLGVLVGLHRVVIGAVISSFRAVPAGTIGSTSNLTELMLNLTSDAVGTGVKLAIPLIAVLLVTQVALAFVSRAAPAMQVFSIGFAVTTSVGAVILIATLPDFGYDVAAEMSRAGERIEALVLAVKGP